MSRQNKLDKNKEKTTMSGIPLFTGVSQTYVSEDFIFSDIIHDKFWESTTMLDVSTEKTIKVDPPRIKINEQVINKIPQTILFSDLNSMSVEEAQKSQESPTKITSKPTIVKIGTGTLPRKPPLPPKKKEKEKTSESSEEEEIQIPVKITKTPIISKPKVSIVQKPPPKNIKIISSYKKIIIPIKKREKSSELSESEEEISSSGTEEEEESLEFSSNRSEEEISSSGTEEEEIFSSESQEEEEIFSSESQEEEEIFSSESEEEEESLELSQFNKKIKPVSVAIKTLPIKGKTIIRKTNTNISIIKPKIYKEEEEEEEENEDFI